MKKPFILLLLISVALVVMSVGCQKNPASESFSPQPEESPSESNAPLQSPSQSPALNIEPGQIDELTTLPLITSDMVGIEGMDKALFDGAVAFLGRQADTPEKMTIPYIGIFGQYESAGKINVVCHVGLEHFSYNEKEAALVRDGTIITYGRAVLTKYGDDMYICDDFTLVRDGEAEASDLKEFCGPLTELADEIYDGLDYTSTFPSPKETEMMYTQATGLTIQ